MSKLSRPPASARVLVAIAIALMMLTPVALATPAEDDPFQATACRLLAGTRAPLSSAAETALRAACEGRELTRSAAPDVSEPREAASADRRTLTSGSAPQPTHPVGINRRVNDPTPDPFVGNGTHITQSEVSVLTLPGNVALMGYNDSTGFAFSPPSFTGWSRSTDGGNSWTDLGALPPTATGQVIGDPVLAYDRLRGNVVFANLFCDTISMATRCPIGVSQSTDSGATFGTPVATWPGIPTADFADKPWMAVDNTPTSPGYGTIYVTWSNFTATLDSPIVLVASTDGGTTWGAPVGVSDPTCAPLAGFPHSGQGSQVVVDPNGDVHVVWWCNGDTGIQIRYDVDPVGPGGFGPDGILDLIPFSDEGYAYVADCTPSGNRRALNGDVRTNDFPSLAVDPASGNLYAAWTKDPDGNPDILGANDVVDVFFSRSTDGGTTWSAPANISNNVNDQFWPMVRVDKNGVVGVGWYDRRLDPGNVIFDTYLTRSTDGGQTFSGFHRITNVSSPIPAINPNYDTFVGNCYMGDYNGMDAYVSGGFLVGWGDNADPGPAANNFTDQNIYSGIHGFCPGLGTGGNHVLGTPANDTLSGTNIKDKMCGLAGNDTLKGRAGADIIDGGGGGDSSTLVGGGGRDTIRGKGGRDKLLGGSGNDDLKGGKGNDVLKGGSGKDVLNGGPGKDTCIGGPGKDKFKKCEKIKQ